LFFGIEPSSAGEEALELYDGINHLLGSDGKAFDGFY
jgi:hypothetical protein